MTKKKEKGLHIHYGGMAIGSLLRKLESDESLAGAREEILAKITAEKAERAPKDDEEKAIIDEAAKKILSKLSSSYYNEQMADKNPELTDALSKLSRAMPPMAPEEPEQSSDISFRHHLDKESLKEFEEEQVLMKKLYEEGYVTLDHHWDEEGDIHFNVDEALFNKLMALDAQPEGWEREKWIEEFTKTFHHLSNGFRLSRGIPLHLNFHYTYLYTMREYFRRAETLIKGYPIKDYDHLEGKEEIFEALKTLVGSSAITTWSESFERKRILENKLFPENNYVQEYDRPFRDHVPEGYIQHPLLRLQAWIKGEEEIQDF